MHKTPDSPSLVNEYGLTFLRSGDLEKAIHYLKMASLHPKQSIVYKQKLDLDLAKAYEKSGYFFAAQKTYQSILQKTHEKSIHAWKGLINLYTEELKRKNPAQRREKLLDSLERSRHGLSDAVSKRMPS